MRVKLGRIDKAKGRCDLCQERRPPIRECVLPYTPKGDPAQFMDLCADCILVLDRDPQPYVTLERGPTHIVAVPGSATG